MTPLQQESSALMALIERAATSTDIDVDKLDKLLAVKERWDAQQAKRAFVDAMSRFRNTCPAVVKNADAHNSRYAKLDHVIRTIQATMQECGLSHSWRTQQEADRISVTCVLTHIDGHSESTTLAASPDTSGSKNPIQAIGSTTSYLERYTLFAILGLASSDDDDGGAPVGVDRIDEGQVADLDAMISEVGADRAAFATYLRKSLKVPEGKIENIPVTAYKDVVGALELKRKQGAK